MHAQREASIVCARCGNFACNQCESELDDQRFCADCLDRLSPLADPGRRLVAHLIDVYVLVTIPVVLALVGMSLSDERVVTVVSGLGVAGIFGVGAVQVLWVHRHGQSIAKRWLQLRVVHLDGRRMSFARIFWARNVVPALLGAIPVVGGLFALMDGLFVFGEQRRTLHDRIAGSIVISVRAHQHGKNA